MTGELTRLDQAMAVPPLDALVDPVVRSACRALARQRFPLGSLEDLPVGEGRALLSALLRPGDLPLSSLREALDCLERRLRAPLPLPERQAPSSQPPVFGRELLAGQDPASRASRRVYRGVLAEPALAQLDELRRQRLAFLRAQDFRTLCEATLPEDRFQGPGATAALHAWAQCHAREYLASSSRTLGPSRCCEQAAQLALAMARRSDADPGGGEEDLAG